MNVIANVDNKSKFDVFKWLVVGVILAGGIFANSYYGAQPASLRLTGWLILACVALVIAAQTQQGRKIWSFAQDARMELRKVVWPTRQETIQTTLLVVATVVITSLLLWGIDSLLLWAVGFLTGQRG